MFKWLKHCLAYRINGRVMTELNNDRLLLRKRLEGRTNEVHQLKIRLAKMSAQLAGSRANVKRLKAKIAEAAAQQ